MTDGNGPPSRREAISTVLATAGIGAALLGASQVNAQPASAQPSGDAALDAHRHDWSWFLGRWNVQHRMLRSRLTGSTDWLEFGGTTEFWETLGGLGNVDDNILNLPHGPRRAMSIRAFDAASGLWQIWWLALSNPVIDPPVRGSFAGGAGVFLADDTYNGRAIKVRYQWTDITTPSPHWEQSWSADGGATWESNWTMRFTRA